MKFFEVIPSELFSPLASPNRVLYADALDVLYNAYRENLKIPEDMLYSMLRSKLEQQLADATFEGEDIDVEELRDVSGRARFLIRKLRDMSLHNYPQILRRNKQRIEKNERSDRIIMRLESYGWNS